MLAEAPPSPGAGAGLSPSTVEETDRRADKARRAARWPEAAAAYRTAWEATGRPAFAGELGLCELSLRRFRDAAEHLRQGLAEREALAPAVRRRFEQGLRKAAQEVAAVAIVVGRPEAEVFVDGRFVGKGLATYLVYVEPGSHEARAKLAGYVDGVGLFEAQRGDAPAVGLELTAKASPPAPRPPLPVPPPGPAHPATQTAIGPVIRIGGLTLASAGVVLGAGFAIASAVKDDDAESQATKLREQGGPAGCHRGGEVSATDCGKLRDTLAARDALGMAALGSFLAGGVIGAAALSSFLWAPAPVQGGARVLPQVTAHGGGVLLECTW